MALKVLVGCKRVIDYAVKIRYVKSIYITVGVTRAILILNINKI